MRQQAGAHFGDLVDALLAGNLAQLQALDLGLGRLPPLAHRGAKEALRASSHHVTRYTKGLSLHAAPHCQKVIQAPYLSLRA